MLLQITDATMQFGGLTAVNNVSLEVPKNSICALIGPNGAGKTTLFNMIAGQLKPTSGIIMFDEKRIDGLPTYRVNNAGISRTYQNINLFKSMTVLENIMVGWHPKLKSGLVGSIIRTRQQKSEELEMICQASRLLSYAGLEKKKDEISSNLSYGEQRLLEICRGMASDPKLLLLDEPAAGMNETEKQNLVKLIRTFRDEWNTTILIVDHEMKLVMSIAEKIFVLNFGLKIAEGTPDEIKRNPDVITAYLGEEGD